MFIPRLNVKFTLLDFYSALKILLKIALYTINIICIIIASDQVIRLRVSCNIFDLNRCKFLISTIYNP